VSGVAVIYLHGGAWYLLDKDTGTRPFFRHLSAQGHVIMDVAYRLAPETDMMGMIHDVKRAIHWLKEKAATYHINPDKIIVSGGSAGAHLALLAAYTFQSSVFSPVELEGRDVSTAGAISLYGPADLEAMYFHTNQQYTTRTKTDAPAMPEPTKMPRWVKKAMGKNYSRLGMDKDVTNGGSFATLLGCQPDQYPENYALYSPLVHVHPQCPPTLLIHGEHDVMAPVKASQRLYSRLMEEDVPTMMHILPQTDHAFDLILPRISPSSHNAIYDIERFLALQAGSLETLNEGNKKTERYSIDLK
jgi:acetyl esterase/lipase